MIDERQREAAQVLEDLRYLLYSGASTEGWLRLCWVLEKAAQGHDPHGPDESEFLDTVSEYARTHLDRDKAAWQRAADILPMSWASILGGNFDAEELRPSMVRLVSGVLHTLGVQHAKNVLVPGGTCRGAEAGAFSGEEITCRDLIVAATPVASSDVMATQDALCRSGEQSNLASQLGLLGRPLGENAEIAVSGINWTASIAYANDASRAEGLAGFYQGGDDRPRVYPYDPPRHDSGWRLPTLEEMEFISTQGGQIRAEGLFLEEWEAFLLKLSPALGLYPAGESPPRLQGRGQGQGPAMMRYLEAGALRVRALGPNDWGLYGFFGPWRCWCDDAWGRAGVEGSDDAFAIGPERCVKPRPLLSPEAQQQEAYYRQHPHFLYTLPVFRRPVYGAGPQDPIENLRPGFALAPVQSSVTPAQVPPEIAIRRAAPFREQRSRHLILPSGYFNGINVRLVRTSPWPYKGWKPARR